MKIGFIGLGTMGSSMAANLHNAGQLHAVWNRSSERRETIDRLCGDDAGFNQHCTR